MSTFKSTNRKKNFSNPFGSLADPSTHIQTNKQTNKQTKLLYYIDYSSDEVSSYIEIVCYAIEFIYVIVIV